MDLLHVALTSSSEDRADGFYVDLLGLKKAEPKVLAAEISRAIFGIGHELTVINYTGGAAHFEVFVCRAAPTPAGHIEHACIAVENLPEFLRRCEKVQVEIIRVPKGESLITFIKDADGNLFEIKEKQEGPAAVALAALLPGGVGFARGGQVGEKGKDTLHESP
ncbi:MAG TPA: VOC family protein [Planctomycetota bacterium]|nr:VOC family protein [Planctomycetota bacterium]